MRVEIEQTKEGMGSISRMDFETYNIQALLSSFGTLIFHWSTGNCDRVIGPVALYMCEFEIWASNLFISSQETCLEIHATPFLYGTRCGDDVEISYYSKMIHTNQQYGFIEKAKAQEIRECVNYIRRRMLEYPA